MLPNAVADYLERHRQQHLAALMDLLRFPSVANIRQEPSGCRRCAEWLAERLAGLGLTAEVVPVEGGHPNIIARGQSSHPGARTVLLYGHYDVQPPEPLEAWHSPPFEPEVRDGCIWARGASDDKGQLMAHLMALEAWQRAGGGLPVNVKLFLEGEEEIGSPRLEPFLRARAGDLRADFAVISDSEFFAPGLPSITYGLRGLAYVEVTLRGPSADVHSGVHGGAVANPVNALAALIAAMHGADGRVALPGFYDDVLPLSDRERAEWAGLPWDEAEYARSLGLDVLGGGEKGYSALERRWARPTLDCNGIVGGYTGPGSKTIIPAQASAKVSMRLVARQDPDRIVEGFRRFVAEHTPPGLTADVKVNAGARPVLLATQSPAMAAARAALGEAFGRAPAMIRCGASVPVTELFQRILGLDAVLMGFSLPDDNIHSPNERYRLDQFGRGGIACAAILHNLAAGNP